MTDRITFTDADLLYAAVSRCRCGAGLAYPMDHKASMQLRAWLCSAVLKGEVKEVATRAMPFGLNGNEQTPPAHDAFEWAFYKVREETSVNNDGARTTRPAGTVARTVGMAACPKCKHKWESEPYDAPTVGHHWRSGACPACGYAVGGNGSWSSNEGPAIDIRFRDVVIASPESPTS